MADSITDLGHGFWNVRGAFRIGGVLNVGTQCSLVRLGSGRFAFLDSYTLAGDVRAEVMRLTDGGRAVQAVLNLHPFHTVHCAQMARDFPHATFYGSARHWRTVPQVAWAREAVESAAVAERFAADLAFSLPAGMAYISPHESVHAGSLLAWHAASGALHVDDTFVTPPRALAWLPGVPRVALHPTTRRALEPHAGSGRAFCDWADALAGRWSVRQLCAAHSARVPFGPGEFARALGRAVARARPKLERAAP